MPGSAFNPQQDAIAKLITQADHEFVAGNVLRRTLGGYALAMADTPDNAEVCGIVIQVPDADTFRMAIEGHVDCFTGLTADTVYWLDPAVPGGLTDVQTIVPGEIQKPVVIATSDTSGYFVTLRGLIVPSGGGGGTGGSSPWEEASGEVMLVNRASKVGLYNSTGTNGFMIGRDFRNDDTDNLFFFDKAAEMMRIFIDENGNVLIGDNQNPAEVLDVRGGIRLGAAVGTENGTIQWTGSDIEGRVGDAWVSLTAQGSGGTSLWEALDANSIGTIGNKRVNIATAQFHVGDSLPAVAVLQDTAAYNSPPSMSFTCIGKFNSAGQYAGMGTFGIRKHNTTDGDLKSSFQVCLRDDSWLYPRFRVDYDGNVYNPNGAGWMSFGRNRDSGAYAAINIFGAGAADDGLPHGNLRLWGQNNPGTTCSVGLGALLRCVDGGGEYNGGGIYWRKSNSTQADTDTDVSIWNRITGGIGGVRERLTIKYDGKVGIGTNAPTAGLHMIAPFNTTGQIIKVQNGYTTLCLTNEGNSVLNFIPMGGMEAEFRIQTSGTDANSFISFADGTNGVPSIYMRDKRLGIGAVEPLAPLDVRGGVHITGLPTAPASGTMAIGTNGGQWIAIQGNDYMHWLSFQLDGQYSYPTLTINTDPTSPPPNYYSGRQTKLIFDSESVQLYPTVYFTAKHQGAAEINIFQFGQNDSTGVYETRFYQNVRIDGTLTVGGSGNMFFNGISYTWPGSQGSAGSHLQNNGSGTLSWVVPSPHPWTDGGTYMYPTNGEVINIYGDGSNALLSLCDSRAHADGVGGRLDFVGKDDDENYMSMCMIRGFSVNLVCGGMEFYTNNGSSLVSVLNLGIDRGLHMSASTSYIGWGSFDNTGNWAGIKSGSSLLELNYDIHDAGSGQPAMAWHTFKVASDDVSWPSLITGWDGSNITTIVNGRLGVSGMSYSTFDTNTTFQIANNSNCRAKAIYWDTYSDARIKDNIVAISKGLTELLLVSPKKYRQYNSVPVWEEDNQRWIHEVDGDSYAERFGFIAQDLISIIPEAVIAPVNADKELYGINYETFIPIIIKAIQELNAKIPI
jgi:hypothetical protein